MAIIKSIEEKAKAYDEAIKVLHKYDGANIMFSQSLKEEMFPELKEDKEERIRKSLLRWVQSNSYTSIAGIPINDVIAWLEKQGEQKPSDKVEPKFKVGDKIKFIGEPTYPAREIIDIKDDAYYFDKFVYLPFSKQDTWELVEQDRIQLRQEWSEDDERFLNVAINILNSSKVYTKSPDKYDDTINWLKLLKERYTWKPSDEQLKGIECAIRTLQHQLNVGDKRLNSLYNDLKKLKEE